ncbi:M3 family oligoendopeptidase [Halobacteriovorax sp. HLS]|uniref:M3 family oligoendopeptidase n=1 Tax=Halobacteriovorax sp. HLS TaxID=2234000 RepID=UPI000FDB38FB|nr:M3 family oligoendopeptidase [Halobacteriovorax sp. HLS]
MTLEPTVWDNSKIYSSINDPKIPQDIAQITTISNSQSSNCSKLANALNEWDSVTLDEQKSLITIAQEVMRTSRKVSVLTRTLSTYVNSILSVDTNNSVASTLNSKISKASADVSKLFSPLEVFLIRLDDSLVENIFEGELSAKRFQVELLRDFKKYTLDVKRESLISGLSTDGLHAWGQLYNDISGKLMCDVDGEKINYASAASLTRGSDGAKRESAWRAIQKAWTEQEVSAAAILNAINGWRLEENTVRSQESQLHYLDVSCQQSRITRETLDSLINSTFEKREVGQRAIACMAKVFGKDKLGPWDLLAPAPKKESKSIPFNEAIDIIEKAFSSLSVEMGDFARMMYEKNWIDAKPSEFRRPGAYCTGFANVREPRVFMTYNGSMGDLITLAHELGHAYHNWVLRDLPIEASYYSMTLAETASIFAETLVRDYLFETLESKEDKMEIAWQNGESAAGMLCNIPARFEFEKNMVEKRKDQTLSANELKELMNGAWSKWYDNSLTEYDEMFWASKLHFSISGLGFYNYPYLFGYLFSLGIMAQRETLGDKFNEAYINLLRDTGTMKVEDLVQKHLGKDVTKSEFWLDSLKVVEKQVEIFEGLV